MSANKTTSIIRQSAVAAALLLGASQAQANDNEDGTAMTAGVIMEKMKPSERFIYVSGVVEGLAYGRFLRDTEKAGQKQQAGMDCIFAWFFENGAEPMDQIEASFQKYESHFPSVVLTALISRKCGE